MDMMKGMTVHTVEGERIRCRAADAEMDYAAIHRKLTEARAESSAYLKNAIEGD